MVDAGSIEHKTRMMYLSLKTLYENNIFIPALNLVCLAIDGIGEKSTKENKREIMAEEKDTYFKSYTEIFPEIAETIEPETFYDIYRNGAAHYFSMKRGYGIGRNKEMDSKYTKEIDSVKFINIDRLVCDFLQKILKIREQHSLTIAYDRMQNLQKEKQSIQDLIKIKYTE